MPERKTEIGEGRGGAHGACWKGGTCRFWRRAADESGAWRRQKRLLTKELQLAGLTIGSWVYTGPMLEPKMEIPGYSLPDCISMQTARMEGLTEVLTNDRHFEQGAFRACSAISKFEPIENTLWLNP